MTTSKTTIRREARKGTPGLPGTGSIRKALVAHFHAQRVAVLGWLKAGKFERKAGYDPDEPRNEHGRWTDGGGGAEGGGGADGAGGTSSDLPADVRPGKPGAMEVDESLRNEEVDNFLEENPDAKVQDVPITAALKEKVLGQLDYWRRSGDERELAKVRSVLGADKLPPPIVQFYSSGRVGIPDGFHRVLAYVLAGRDSIRGYAIGSPPSKSLRLKAGPADNLPAAFPSLDDLRLGSLAFSERMTPVISSIWDAAGTQFTTKIGLDPDSWSVVNPRTKQAIRDATLKFADSTNRTTSMQLDDALSELRDSLEEGIVEEGESLDDLADRVGEIFDQAEGYRARRIAATETSRAVHGAEYQAGKESGVVTGWRWVASADACEEICQVIADEAQFVPMDQSFATIGDGEYADIDYPPAHPSCGCTYEPVIDSDEQPDWSDTLTDADFGGGDDAEDEDDEEGKKN